MQLRVVFGGQIQEFRNRRHQKLAVNLLWTEKELCRNLAARLGLEPRQNESESFVLPLHHRAVE